MKKVLITLGSVAMFVLTGCGGSATQSDTTLSGVTSTLTQTSLESESAVVVSVNDAANETATNVSSYPPIPQIPEEE